MKYVLVAPVGIGDRHEVSPKGQVPSIVLINPKYARNVSMVCRIASCFEVKQVWFTGNRVSLTNPELNVNDEFEEFGLAKNRSKKPRLPREERFKGYKDVKLLPYAKPLNQFENYTPIAVELCNGAETLVDFVHPENAVYVFGPEDGGVTSVWNRLCHRRLFIPTRHCLNLATSISIILYDRYLKEILSGARERQTMEELLMEDRAFLRQGVA